MNCHSCEKSCHDRSQKKAWWQIFSRNSASQQLRATDSQIALVGTPNVGKSVLFNKLTGVYVTVSNYPGTTVEVTRGSVKIGDRNVSIIDTPGMYSLVPISDEEKVARDLLLKEPFDAVIHVIDAKNLGRMLPLTFQLMEAGLPVVLAINMMDEADRLGLNVQAKALKLELGIPVVLMSAALNRGVESLKNEIATFLEARPEVVGAQSFAPLHQ